MLIKQNMKAKGFTLIEILIVLAIIAMLASVVIVAINPAHQFAEARNTQRWTAVNSILNAVHQNMVDNSGIFNFSNCNASSLPSTATEIKKNGGVDLCGCLVPTYLPALPTDPSAGTPKSGVSDCSADYDTGYTIYQNATTSRVTVSAPHSEIGVTITVTR